MSEQEPAYLRTDEAARLVRLAPNTLKNMRARGGGPPWRKLGKIVVYNRDELIAWVEARSRDYESKT